MSTGAPGQTAQRKAIVALGAAAMAAIAGFAAVYVTLGRPDNAVPPARTTVAQPPAQPQTAPAGPGSNPLSQGHVAAFVFRKAPEALPEVKFQDAAGKRAHLGGLARQGGARSTYGPPGVCPAARKCLPSTGCRKRWGRTSSRWLPSASTAKARRRPRSFSTRPRSSALRSTSMQPRA